MYYRNNIDETLYAEHMDLLKKMNKEYIEIRRGQEYKIGMYIIKLKQELKHLNLSEIKKNVEKHRNIKRAGKLESHIKMVSEQDKARSSNYFSTERVAVYTCIFGNYDGVNEPVCCPDNCDYYIISDTVKAQKNSKWKIVDITEFAGALEGLSNTEKNRYFKMHPDKVFKNYKYSIYIYGNVKVITDLTEMVNKIGSCGVAIHKHGKRDCVYDEVNTILAMKKDTKENLEKHIEFLKKIGFPKPYGLLECNIIAREHFNPTCQKLMDMWWQDFMTLSKRDQMSLPSVLFRNDIPVSEVGVLGTGVENDYAIRVEGHR